MRRTQTADSGRHADPYVWKREPPATPQRHSPDRTARPNPEKPRRLPAHGNRRDPGSCQRIWHESGTFATNRALCVAKTVGLTGFERGAPRRVKAVWRPPYRLETSSSSLCLHGSENRGAGAIHLTSVHSTIRSITVGTPSSRCPLQPRSSSPCPTGSTSASGPRAGPAAAGSSPPDPLQSPQPAGSRASRPTGGSRARPAQPNRYRSHPGR